MPNKEHERFIIESFRDFYEDFPVGTLLQDERPDFTVTNGNVIIGIEIAEIFQDSHLQNGSQLKRLESIEDKFEKSLLEILQKLGKKILLLASALVVMTVLS